MIDLVLSLIATVVAMALSWAVLRDFHYWPVSHAAWLVYFGLGFVLALFVFYVFIQVLHTLFAHDVLTREKTPGAGQDERGAP
jgi:uncharacterized membrane protein